MFTRIVALVLLMAFLNSIIGCANMAYTKRVEVPVNNLTEGKKKITEVTLETGEIVKFNDDGARYLQTDIVSGRDTDGKAVGVPLQHIGEIRVSKPQTVTKEDAEGKKIVEAIFFNGYIVKFDNRGGKYDSITRKVSGHTKSGTLIERNIDSFRELRISSPDTIARESLLATKGQHIAEVTEGSFLITFNEDGGKFEEGKFVIVGRTKEGKQVAISINEIASAKISKINVLVTAAYIVGITCFVYCVLDGLTGTY